MSGPTSGPIDDDRRRRDIAVYWVVHASSEDAVRGRVREELGDDPDLKPVVNTMFEADDAAAQQRTLVERAVNDGEWEPYLAWLRETGRAYAAMGLRLEHWFRIVHVYRQAIVPHIMEAYGDDPDQLAAAVRGKGAFYDLALETIGEAYLAARQQTIVKQQAAISELSTPVLRIRPGLLLMPVVGVIDTTRSRQLTEALLQAIRHDRARVVVMDITGVAEVDSEVANRLLQAAQATRLMGATPIITGISAGVAQTLVALGVDLEGLLTLGDLQSGIQQAHDLLGVRVVDERALPSDR